MTECPLQEVIPTVIESFRWGLEAYLCASWARFESLKLATAVQRYHVSLDGDLVVHNYVFLMNMEELWSQM